MATDEEKIMGMMLSGLADTREDAVEQLRDMGELTECDEIEEWEDW